MTEHKENITDEWCPHCDSEVVIDGSKLSPCPNCGIELFPCSACPSLWDNGTCTYNNETKSCEQFAHKKI